MAWYTNLLLYVLVVNQRYDPEVQSPSGFLGNNVLMRCNVPSFVRDHVTVTSWLQEPVFNIYPSTMGGKSCRNQYIVVVCSSSNSIDEYGNYVYVHIYKCMYIICMYKLLFPNTK